jgi:hypothetical protein
MPNLPRSPRTIARYCTLALLESLLASDREPQIFAVAVTSENSECSSARSGPTQHVMTHATLVATTIFAGAEDQLSQDVSTTRSGCTTPGALVSVSSVQISTA